jgi:hypothetical protein
MIKITQDALLQKPETKRPMLEAILFVPSAPAWHEFKGLRMSN